MAKKWYVTLVKGQEFKKVTVSAPSHAQSREVALKENPGYEVFVSQSAEKN